MSNTDRVSSDGYEELATVLYHMRYLNSTQRGDFASCELAGMTRTERAAERGVQPPTVMGNVANAKERLEKLTDVDMDSFTVKYNLEHPEAKR